MHLLMYAGSFPHHFAYFELFPPESLSIYTSKDCRVIYGGERGVHSVAMAITNIHMPKTQRLQN